MKGILLATKAFRVGPHYYLASGVGSSRPTKSLIADVTWYSIRPTGVLNQRGFNHAALMRRCQISSEEQSLSGDASDLELKTYLDSHC